VEESAFGKWAALGLVAVGVALMAGSVVKRRARGD
jgi:hypothetical protein